MTTDLYLIAHKVRGEPAFDIATRMQCPHCEGTPLDSEDQYCHECDELGYWWIIPTSGHRAYPYYDQELSELGCDISWPGEPEFEPFLKAVPSMPEGLPDHYTTRAAPTLDLSTALGLTARKAPSVPIKRRF